jgi:hypothetical protein
MTSFQGGERTFLLSTLRSIQRSVYVFHCVYEPSVVVEIFFIPPQLSCVLLLRCRPESVPEGASVQWEVELLEFESAKVRYIRSLT